VLSPRKKALHDLHRAATHANLPLLQTPMTKAVTKPKFPLGQPAENPVVSATRQNVPAWLLSVVMYSGVS